MTSYQLTVVLFLCPFFTIYGDILNGFAQKKMFLESRIKLHKNTLSEASTPRRIKQLTKELKSMQKDYDLVSRKSMETNQLLKEVKEIDPDLYKQVSKVTNADGTLTQVVVQYVSRVDDEYSNYVDNHFKADAYTSVRPNKDDNNVCESRFGTNTNTIGYGCNARKALGHEFAHVLYIVPNLSAYFEYWKASDNFCNGHHIEDPSFDFLEKTENEFFQKHHEYTSRLKQELSAK